MANCPAKYKNLGLTSFDEQKDITVQMLRQICMNDEWLKQEIEKVKYETPAVNRKRFSPIAVDSNNSYGYKISSNNDVVFDSSTSKEIEIDFSDLSLIDTAKTTCAIESIIDKGQIINQAKVKKQTTSSVDKSTRNYSPWAVKDSSGNIIGGDMIANEHWYVGFDRNRHYETRPNWLENQLNNEIPSVGRAQTFEAKKTGLLESVVLNIKVNEGQDKHNTASPLIVQIRKTVEKDGAVYPEELACGYDGKYSVLAEQEIRFINTSPNIVSIPFDHPCTVEQGQTYAIVVLSPLSHPTHTYWLGGWNKHCHADAYTEGDAFFTFNNGMTWIKYGKDDDVEYHQGKYAPQDFAFQAHIREFKTGYITNTDEWLYLKPIFSNPVKRVRINAIDTGEASDDNLQLEYWGSNDGRNWTKFTNNQLYFNIPNCMTFIKVRMRTKINDTPIIEYMRVELETDIPEQMYVRTHYYFPKTSAMLGANAWAKVNAPFKVEPSVSCEAEIIRNCEVMEHFVIIEPKDIQNFTWLNEIDAIKVTGKTNSQNRKYLVDHPSAVEALKEHQIYVTGYMENEVYVPGFFDGFEFTSSPAYPIIECTLQPITGETKIYGEWYDFTFDYGNDKLTFFSNVLQTIVPGTLTIKYNPLFIDHLANEEMPLILDYFKETIQITEDMLNNRKIPLRAPALDPLRDIFLNGEEIIEDNDFTMDYNTNELCFPVVNIDDQSTILSLNDILEVVYTPSLDDAGISIGYYATRENIRKQCYIKPNYMEFKT